MAMKILILFALFATNISLGERRNSAPVAFDVLNPGFRARIATVPRMESVKLNVSVNHDGTVDGDWQYSVTLDPRPWADNNNDTWYTYENTAVRVNTGDIFYYQSEIITDIFKLNGFGTYEVPGPARDDQR